MQYPGSAAFGNAQHIHHADRRSFDGFDRIVLVSLGGCGTSQVVNLIGFDEQRPYDVVTNQLKPRMADKMADVLLRSGKEIIDADNILSHVDQPVAQVTPQKAGASGNQYRFA